MITLILKEGMKIVKLKRQKQRTIFEVTKSFLISDNL